MECELNLRHKARGEHADVIASAGQTAKEEGDHQQDIINVD